MAPPTVFFAEELKNYWPCGQQSLVLRSSPLAAICQPPRLQPVAPAATVDVQLGTSASTRNIMVDICFFLEDYNCSESKMHLGTPCATYNVSDSKEAVDISLILRIYATKLYLVWKSIRFYTINLEKALVKQLSLSRQLPTNVTDLKKTLREILVTSRRRSIKYHWSEESIQRKKIDSEEAFDEILFIPWKYLMKMIDLEKAFSKIPDVFARHD